MQPDPDTAPRPIATVDLTIFALTEDGLDVLLTRRAAPPYSGAWALPGGFVHVDEDVDLEAAARRVLLAKTGVETPYLEQLATFGDGRRDPRGWSLSVVYMALLGGDPGRAAVAGLAPDAQWMPVDGETVAVSLAFDHAGLLKAGLARLRAKVEYTSLPAHLLPETFTLGELQAVYERLLGRRLDKSAFRKRIAEADVVVPVPGALRRASHRPAQLYRLRAAGETVVFDRTI